MYPLEIERVTKRYGHEVVVDDLSFTVAPGRVTGFLGPYGAGKSTTMKILLDLASADSGHATIAATRYRDLKDPAWTVGLVLQPNAFHRGRSGRNHLRVVADGSGIPRHASTSCSRWLSWRTRQTAALAATRWESDSGSDWQPRCSRDLLPQARHEHAKESHEDH
jgi:ABC-type multidrug transport system ATPase subunit